MDGIRSLRLFSSLLLILSIISRFERFVADRLFGLTGDGQNPDTHIILSEIATTATTTRSSRGHRLCFEFIMVMVVLFRPTPNEREHHCVSPSLFSSVDGTTYLRTFICLPVARRDIRCFSVVT